MIVIADTSPINYLVLIGQIEVLPNLAESVNADRLIIDDLEGRREASRRNLSVIGTLGVPAEASRRGLLDLAQALESLQATNFHVAPILIKLLLEGDANNAK
jgi:predicted nucleic acid-binding protein